MIRQKFIKNIIMNNQNEKIIMTPSLKKYLKNDFQYKKVIIY